MPKTLDVGDCLVGSIKVVRFTIKNTGGPGRFCIMPTSDWPQTSLQVIRSLNSLSYDFVFYILSTLLTKNYEMLTAVLERRIQAF